MEKKHVAHMSRRTSISKDPSIRSVSPPRSMRMGFTPPTSKFNAYYTPPVPVLRAPSPEPSPAHSVHSEHRMEAEEVRVNDEVKDEHEEEETGEEETGEEETAEEETAEEETAEEETAEEETGEESDEGDFFDSDSSEDGEEHEDAVIVEANAVGVPIPAPLTVRPGFSRTKSQTARAVAIPMSPVRAVQISSSKSGFGSRSAFLPEVRPLSTMFGALSPDLATLQNGGPALWPSVDGRPWGREEDLLTRSPSLPQSPEPALSPALSPASGSGGSLASASAAFLPPPADESSPALAASIDRRPSPSAMHATRPMPKRYASMEYIRPLKSRNSLPVALSIPPRPKSVASSPYLRSPSPHPPPTVALPPIPPAYAKSSTSALTPPGPITINKRNTVAGTTPDLARPTLLTRGSSVLEAARHDLAAVNVAALPSMHRDAGKETKQDSPLDKTAATSPMENGIVSPRSTVGVKSPKTPTFSPTSTSVNGSESPVSEISNDSPKRATAVSPQPATMSTLRPASMAIRTASIPSASSPPKPKVLLNGPSVAERFAFLERKGLEQKGGAAKRPPRMSMPPLPSTGLGPRLPVVPLRSPKRSVSVTENAPVPEGDDLAAKRLNGLNVDG
jgi:hypothetical protein